MFVRQRRAQSSMEYLMTYAWAILILAVAVGVLYQLGIFNSSLLSPRAPAGACKIIRTPAVISTTGECAGQLPQFVAKFNGANSYMQVGSSAFWYSDALTVSLWLQVQDWGSNSPTPIGTFISNYNWRLYMWTAGTAGFYSFYNKVGGGQSYTVPTTSGITLGRWYHLLMTRNFSGSTVTSRMYLNGVLMDSQIYNDFLSWYQDTSQPLRIGTDSGNSWPYIGMMSNVQLYDTSFAADEAMALYSEGIGGAPIKPQDTIGWWPLNGDTNDYSGNNKHGISNSISYTTQWTTAYH